MKTFSLNAAIKAPLKAYKLRVEYRCSTRCMNLHQHNKLHINHQSILTSPNAEQMPFWDEITERRSEICRLIEMFTKSVWRHICKNSSNKSIISEEVLREAIHMCCVWLEFCWVCLHTCLSDFSHDLPGTLGNRYWSRAYIWASGPQLTRRHGRCLQLQRCTETNRSWRNVKNMSRY